MKKRTILLAPIVLILLLAGGAYFCSFTVSENECVIVTRFGKHVRTVDEPGLHFKQPGFIETANYLDRKIHIVKNLPITLLLHDKLPIIVVCDACWRVSDPERFFQRLRDVNNASGKIGDMLNSQLGSVLGNYDLDNIINVDEEKAKLPEIEARVVSKAEEQASTEYGIEVVQVGIRRLAYPSIVEQSVYSRMRAEREKEAKKHRAEGAEEAVKIQAQTDLEVSEIMAEAYRDAQILKGTADKEAMRIYAEAHGRDPEFYEFLKSLDIYQETLRQNATLILSTDSDLFKYLGGGLDGTGSVDPPETLGDVQREGEEDGE